MISGNKISIIKTEYLYIPILIFIVLIFTDKIWFLFFPLLFLLFLLNQKSPTKSIFPISFILIMAFPDSLGMDFRLIIQLITLFLLLITFLVKYGIDFKSYPKVEGSVILLVIVYFISIFISTIFSDYSGEAVSHISRTFQFFLIVYLFLGLIQSEEDIKIVIKTFHIMTILFSIMLFYELVKMNFDLIKFNKDLILYDDEMLFHKNHIGLFYLISIILIITQMFNPDVSKRTKRILPYILVFMFMALILTNSRGALISTFIGIGFIFYQLNRKYLKILIFTLLAISSLFLLEPVQESVGFLLRVESVFTGRDVITQTIIKVIENNFIFGAGPSASRFEMYKELPFMIGSAEESYLRFFISRQEFGHAHNFYLFLLSDLGILGLFTAILFPVIYFKLGFSAFRNFKQLKDENYYILIGLLAIGISIFTRAIFEWGNLLSYGTLSGDLPFWLITLIIMHYYMKSKSNTKQFD